MRYLYLLSAAVFILFTAGCASSPDRPIPTESQLEVLFSVAGSFAPSDSIDPSITRHYFIAIDADNIHETFPLPIAAPSGAYGWGNGWGTSDKASESKGITGYIRYDNINDPACWYDIIPGSKLLSSGPPQIPVSADVLDKGKSFRAVIDFSQLATDELPAEALKNLQINIICTNRIPTDPNDPAPGRKWDALGYKSERDYIDIDVTETRSYSGSDPEGDVSDPDLDITDWEVNVIRR